MAGYSGRSDAPDPGATRRASGGPGLATRAWWTPPHGPADCRLTRPSPTDWLCRTTFHCLSCLWKRTFSAKSKLGEAIRYALTRWDGLSRFLDDGRIDLDSNTVERSIRPLALNRKNALFAGSDEGGDNWAVIATLIENCKLSGINPHIWMTDTLARLANGHPANGVGELMPWTAVG